jgi:hypothetical protein
MKLWFNTSNDWSNGWVREDTLYGPDDERIEDTAPVFMGDTTYLMIFSGFGGTDGYQIDDEKDK